MSAIRDVAVGWAETLGTAALPVRAGKRPAVSRWTERTAESLHREQRWVGDVTAYGLRLDGLTVVDVDDRSQLPAVLDWLGSPATLVVATPRGAHVYFRGEVPPAKYSWGDVLSGPGRYVLGPLSVRDDGGSYDLPDVYPERPAPLPACLDESSPERAADLALLGRLARGRCDDRPDWLAVMGAYRLRYGDSVEDELRAWSAASEAYDARTWRRDWRSLKGPGDKPADAVTMATVQMWADDDSGVPQVRVRAAQRPQEPEAGGDRWAEIMAMSRIDSVPGEPPPAVVSVAGTGLLFGGETTFLYGLPGTGKSWAAVAFAAQTVQGGGRALYVCYERQRPTIIRSQGLGLTKRGRAEHWLAPKGQHFDERPEDALEWLDDAERSILIIDSMARAGVPTDGSPFQEWMDSHVTRFEAPTRAILLIDHSRKNQSGANQANLLGSVTKTATADATYQMETGEGRITEREMTQAKANHDHAPETMILRIDDGVPVVMPGEAEESATYADVLAGRLSKRRAALIAGVPASTYQSRYEKWKKRQ